ncbi:MAG: response regulator [Proteobacteria bacterium]|nr:response regulator [Pseudomonadota bacterium]
MKPLTKIMLAEDDDNIREIAERLLTKLNNLEVTSCASGQELLDTVIKEKPQLILLDVMMPEMDGLTTFKRLKEMNEVKDIPVIFSTARVMPNQVKEYLNLGAIGVIAKPYEPKIFGDTIQKIWYEHHHQKFSTGCSTDHKRRLEDELNTLYQTFSNDLSGNILAIRSYWEKICSQPWNKEQWDQLFMQVHKLKGSTGTFGFKDLYDILRNLETILSELDNIKPSLQQKEQIHLYINSLVSALDKSIGRPS